MKPWKYVYRGHEIKVVFDGYYRLQMQLVVDGEIQDTAEGYGTLAGQIAGGEGQGEVIRAVLTPPTFCKRAECALFIENREVLREGMQRSWFQFIRP